MRVLSRDETKQRIDAGNALVIEALSEDRYREEGHLPGAVQLWPFDAHSSVLPADKNQAIITYCAKESCPNSAQLAAELEKLGYTNVAAYEGGKADWEAAGLPLER